MRFSLGTLVLLTLWIGALIPVIAWRHAWEKVGSFKPIDGDWQRAISPDGTRECVSGPANSGSEISWAIVDLRTNKQIELIWMYDGSQFVKRFIDDNTLEFGELSFSGIVKNKSALYRRRFPEWWWGHFYRPEVWCALVLTVLLAWHLAKRKQMTTDK